MKQKGFTLIEIMVVLSITAVLGMLGIAGFTNYNQTQVLQTSANGVVTMLNLAKSRAQSQIKPSGDCTAINDSLSGYSVVISNKKNYTLKLRCAIAGEITIGQQNKVLPTGLSFDINQSFFFPIQTGGAETPGQIIITDPNGKIKVIMVNSLGRISMLSVRPTAAPTPTPTPLVTPTPTSAPLPTPLPNPNTYAGLIYSLEQTATLYGAPSRTEMSYYWWSGDCGSGTTCPPDSLQGLLDTSFPRILIYGNGGAFWGGKYIPWYITLPQAQLVMNNIGASGYYSNLGWTFWRESDSRGYYIMGGRALDVPLNTNLPSWVPISWRSFSMEVINAIIAERRGINEFPWYGDVTKVTNPPFVNWPLFSGGGTLGDTVYQESPYFLLTGYTLAKAQDLLQQAIPGPSYDNGYVYYAQITAQTVSYTHYRVIRSAVSFTTSDPIRAELREAAHQARVI